MTLKRFFLLLLIISTSTLILVNLSRNLNPVFSQNYTLSIWSILLFTFVCAAIYPLSVASLDSRNKYLFNYLTMGFVFLKMLLSLVLIIGYKWRFHPDNYLFIAPFFIIYLIFTVFEVYFTMKLISKKKENS